MRIPTIALAKEKDPKDYVVLNADDKERIEARRKQGYVKEISLDDNKKAPGKNEKK